MCGGGVEISSFYGRFVATSEHENYCFDYYKLDSHWCKQLLRVMLQFSSYDEINYSI